PQQMDFLHRACESREMPAAWKRVRSQRENDYHVLTIREDIVLDPRDGEEHPRVVVTCTDWVQVIPVTRAGEVVMVRQYRVAAGTASLEMPGWWIRARIPRLRRFVSLRKRRASRQIM